MAWRTSARMFIEASPLVDAVGAMGVTVSRASAARKDVCRDFKSALYWDVEREGLRSTSTECLRFVWG